MSEQSLRAALAEAGKSIKPPPKLSYSAWGKEHYRLVSGANVGRFRPWKFQEAWLDAFGDPLVERVSIIKCAQVGYTSCLTCSIGADAANDPTSVILLMPTDDDARGIVVDDIDPAFRDVPVLSDLMVQGRYDGRNTLTQRVLRGGGSLKVLSARAPRNLRRHRARKLYCDEVDGMEVTKEGDPIELAVNRTISFADRKIIMGSTPSDDVTSIIIRQYEQSNRQIFEVKCPHCEEFFELLWEHIAWEKGRPETVHAVCPSNGCIIEEKYKPAMVDGGHWRAQNPEIIKHVGFRINALVSLQPNSTWQDHVQSYEKARRAGPAQMQPFVNTVLGKPWSSAIDAVSEAELMSRVEPFRLRWDNDKAEWDAEIPTEVSFITAGVDVQGDRCEITFVGWSRNQRWILGHEVVRGATNLESTWSEVDSVLSTTWRHPLGGSIGVEAAGVDSGDGNRTQEVYNFVASRSGRKIVAIKGAAGARPAIKAAAKRSKKAGVIPYIVGVDGLKADILSATAAEKGQTGAFRFSDCLDEQWFMQFTAERRVVDYVSGRPVQKFERIQNRQAEALDCVVYALAVRGLCRFDFETRDRELAVKPALNKSTMKSSLSRLHG